MARKKKDASSIDNYIKPSPGLSFFLNGGYEGNVAAARKKTQKSAVKVKGVLHKETREKNRKLNEPKLSTGKYIVKQDTAKVSNIKAELNANAIKGAKASAKVRSARAKLRLKNEKKAQVAKTKYIKSIKSKGGAEVSEQDVLNFLEILKSNEYHMNITPSQPNVVNVKSWTEKELQVAQLINPIALEVPIARSRYYNTKELANFNIQTNELYEQSYKSRVSSKVVKALEANNKNLTKKVTDAVNVAVEQAANSLETFIKTVVFSPIGLNGWEPLSAYTIDKKRFEFSSPEPTSFNVRWGTLRDGITVTATTDYIGGAVNVIVAATRIDFPGQINYLCKKLGRDFISINKQYQRVFREAFKIHYNQLTFKNARI